MVRSTLVVDVEDSTWQKQLFTLRSQILERLHKATGSNAVTEIEFRAAVARREPQRADGSRNSLFTATDASDEAEQIQDAVLKKVYRLSRKKATA